MGSFSYGEHTSKHIGIHIKYYKNEDIVKMVKKSKLKRFFDTVERVTVCEYDKKTNQVWLQIWCKNIIDSIRKKHRYNVFHIKTNINPYWSCYDMFMTDDGGDIGDIKYDYDLNKYVYYKSGDLL